MPTLHKTEVEDGPMISFGPRDSDTGMQLSIPSRFERRIANEEKNLELVISCEFVAERVDVRSIRVSTILGGSVGTRDLTQLSLPTLVHQICVSVIPNSEYWLRALTDETIGWTELKTSDAFVAQIYWLEYVAHGNPRATIMNYFGMPRSSCNLLLRKLKQRFEMPNTG